MTPVNFSIEPATFPADERPVTELLIEYRDTSPHEVCFRSFENEISELRTRYASPAGGILLARQGDAVAGCIGWWRINETACEMRRLYVRPSFRGQGLGRQLVHAFVTHTRQLGYTSAEWHSLAAMESAMNLYRSMGFDEIHAKEPGAAQPIGFRCRLDEVLS